ncbi:hypothetical protein CDD83_6528 [Cordyceps sp. RAO-2017]|nr:hypothetical protein CDD83_6528 [Cordyceps sp. RAO-2017]
MAGAFTLGAHTRTGLSCPAHCVWPVQSAPNGAVGHATQWEYRCRPAPSFVPRQELLRPPASVFCPSAIHCPASRPGCWPGLLGRPSPWPGSHTDNIQQHAGTVLGTHGPIVSALLHVALALCARCDWRPALLHRLGLAIPRCDTSASPSTLAQDGPSAQPRPEEWTVLPFSAETWLDLLPRRFLQKLYCPHLASAVPPEWLCRGPATPPLRQQQSLFPALLSLVLDSVG